MASMAAQYTINIIVIIYLFMVVGGGLGCFYLSFLLHLGYYWVGRVQFAQNLYISSKNQKTRREKTPQINHVCAPKRTITFWSTFHAIAEA